MSYCVVMRVVLSVCYRLCAVCDLVRDVVSAVVCVSVIACACFVC